MNLIQLLLVSITIFTFSKNRIAGVEVDDIGSLLPGVKVVEQFEKPGKPNGTITDFGS